jgi:hypothetical protein
LLAAEPVALVPERTAGKRLRSVFGEERFFLILSVFIGVFSGLAVVCFRFAIDWCRLYLLGSGYALSPARLLLAPTVAGLVIAGLVIHVFPLARGSGVNQTKAALYIYNGYIPLRTAVGKFITAALAIGSGHSLGPEDPSLQIGAGIASALGGRLHLTRDRMRLIAPVGAAAGLAAAFNAPISAVLFVIEEVHWPLECRHPGLGCAFRGVERGGHALVFGLRVAFSDPARGTEKAVGTHCLCGPRSGRRSGFGRIFGRHCRAPSALSGPCRPGRSIFSPPLRAC